MTVNSEIARELISQCLRNSRETRRKCESNREANLFRVTVLRQRQRLINEATAAGDQFAVEQLTNLIIKPQAEVCGDTTQHYLSVRPREIQLSTIGGFEMRDKDGNFKPIEDFYTNPDLTGDLS